MRIGKLIKLKSSSLIWVFIYFLIGVLAVFISWNISIFYTGPELIGKFNIVSIAIIYGMILSYSYHIFSDEYNKLTKYNWRRNFLINIVCNIISVIALILFFYIFFLQIGRILLVILFLVSLTLSFFVRFIISLNIKEDKFKLILITDKEHLISSQMNDLLKRKYDIENVDLSNLFMSSIDSLIKEWKEMNVKEVVSVVRCDEGIKNEIFLNCWKIGIKFTEWNYFIETQFNKVNVYDTHLDWTMQLGQDYLNPTYSKLKRTLDIICSMIGIIICFPILFFVAILIIIFQGRPIFYTQIRMGNRETPFKFWKFRTMKCTSNKNFSTVTEEKHRITRLGNFLRKSRIDELPQLFQVLSGKMSLVGPRPDWIEESKKWELEIPFYSYRTMIKPGLTGWAQVMTSYAETKEEELEKLSYDFYYIKNANLSLDIRILLRTIVAMFEGGR